MQQVSAAGLEPADDGRAAVRRGLDACAALLVALAFAAGVSTTRDLKWPYDMDHFRDIAQAQTIADGAVLSDPFYAGELSWYPPGVPTLVAALAWIVGEKVPIVFTRAGAYLNLPSPAAFYLLVLTLFGRRVALGALCGYLFLAAMPVWQSPTYTPWLFVSSFAQALFYLAVAVAVRGLRGGSRTVCLAAGILLGATFLAHSAPAMLAGAVVTVVGGARVLEAPRGAERVRRLTCLSVILAAGALLSLVYVLPLAVRYRMNVLNLAPLVWIDPALTAANAGAFLRASLSPAWITLLVLAGGVAALRWRGPGGDGRRVLWVWTAAALALFVASGWLRDAFRDSSVERLPLPPSHHFLLYLRAAGCVFLGLGLVALAAQARQWLLRLAAGRGWAWAARVPRGALLAAELAAILSITLPSYVDRQDLSSGRDFSRRTFTAPEFRLVVPWLREHSDPGDVVLTTESAGLTLVAPAGRRVVVVDKFFSNPYVSWLERAQAQQRMWFALETGDCEAFRREARARGVSLVMTVAGRTPAVAPGLCGLDDAGFPGRDLRFFRLGDAGR